MGRSNNNDQDIHDRHPSETQSAAPTETNTSDKPKFSWPGETAKAQQEVRDSFYKENGVKADLTGGKVPESEQ